MIKVVYLIDTLETGGAETSLVKMALSFKKIKPIFINIYNGDALKNKLVESNIEVHSLNIPDGYNFKLAVDKLRPLIQSIKPDIIHSTLFKSDIISRKLINQHPVLLINSLVNNSYLGTRYDSLNAILKFKLFAIQIYDRITSKNVDLFISNSEAIKKTNAQALRIPLNKIIVIPRGRKIDNYINVSEDSVSKLKIELGIKGKKVLLNVSRLLQRKGQLDLLEGFSKLIVEYPNTVLLIAGEGSYRKELELFIINNKLQGKVLLLGNRTDVPVLLKIANIFVFPSWYEGLPGALIEAMMSGVPIIASDIPENLECIDHSNSYIFKKGNVQDLINKMTSALLNEGESIRKAEMAKTIAFKKFSINKVVDDYEKLYEKILINYKGMKLSGNES